ncbi:hypothetical protein AN958_04462 [Leucoagaricus sp. SymC.cos]|nr:hypothetical protein AN958_04462 [Leucoagaricus sp. SymC.cos]
MPPTHPHTVNAPQSMYIQDDDDGDICPVCDGECTCDNKPRVAQQSLSLNQYSLQYAGSSSSSIISSIPVSPPKPSLAPLKIKLTVPPNLLGNKKHVVAPNKSKNSQGTMSAFAPAGETQHSTLPQGKQLNSSLPKRRGRPPKAVIAAREAKKAKAAARLQTSPPPSPFSQPSIPKNVGSSKRKKSGPQQKRGLKAGRTGHKRPLKRKRRATGDDESSLSNLTDADYDCDDDDDGESVKYPTFLSASALSSMESSNSSASSDSESLSFGSDSDLEKEEESYIVSQLKEKARLRRELLGEDGRRNHSSQSDWVIRPRKKSVDSSDNEMNVDSDGTEDEEEEEDPEEDAEETDGRGAGAGYTGLVTAWSDDDESSFDADIFFANLTDSDNSDSSCSLHDEAGDDGDLSDMETGTHSDTAELISRRQELENLQLEVTQGWDGQIVFTNGLNDGRGVLDIDFEVKASQFMAEESPVPAQDSDVEMTSSSIGSSGEGGYEEDADGGEGDTTDDGLVGDDDLPNERAMQLFSLPFSVSAINPLSTVSPVVSPAPHRHLSSSGLDPPKPEDILAGKVFWDSDDHDHEEEKRRERSRSQESSQSRGPRTGFFIPVQETRKAIIDGTGEVPSPHPRFNRRRSSSTTSKVNVVEQMLRRHLLNNTRSTPTFTTASELLSPLRLLSSDNDVRSPSPSLPLSTLTEESEPLADSIDLDDVLEASYLAPESSETGDNSLTKRVGGDVEEDDKLSSGKHLQNLNRWDLISVGAFRQTRENGGWSSDNHPHTPHSSVDYNNIMRASPLSAIMWPKEKERQRRRRNLSEPMSISPVILPVRDGDRTPTAACSHQQRGFDQTFNKNSQKLRKESKRERKLKKKNWGPLIKYATMDEDDYVETSDVEELGDAYGLQAESNLNSLDMAMKRHLFPRRSLSPCTTSPDYETPRKRRKLTHLLSSPAGLYVASSQPPSVPSETPHIVEEQTEEASRTPNLPEVKMEVDHKTGSQKPVSSREGIQNGSTIDDGTMLEHVNPSTSWITPHKPVSSQKEVRSSQKPSPVPHNYEGDLLNQFEHSLSPQVFSQRPASKNTTLRKSQRQDGQEESEDELATIPSKTTSPPITSETESRASGTGVVREETPLSFPISSRLSPAESTHSFVRNENTRPESTESTSRMSASRGSTVETESVEDVAITRYPLRRRQPNQLRPYLYDDYQYKTVLKHNPAAIVDVLRLRGRRSNHQEDRYEDEEEYVQEESQQVETGGEEQMETQEERVHSPAPVHLPFIDHLSQKDEIQMLPMIQLHLYLERLVPLGALQLVETSGLPQLNLDRHLGEYRVPGVEPEPPPSQKSPSSLGQTRATPEVIELEDELSPAGKIRRHKQDSDVSEDSEDLNADEPADLDKRYRELFKLYPPAMARKLLEKGKNQHRTRRMGSDEPVEEGPLLPGQSRVRRAANPRDLRDICGDSDSDDSETERRSPSPQYMYNGDIRDFMDFEASPDNTWVMPLVEGAQEGSASRPASRLHSVRHSTAPMSEVVDISSEDSTSSSEEEEVDEEDIRTLLGDDDAGIVYEADAGRGTVKEESMIDWMLSRTRIVGSTISKPRIVRRRLTGPHRSNQSRSGHGIGARSSGARPSGLSSSGRAHSHGGGPHPSSHGNKGNPRYKLDIRTGDARKLGKERQTLLLRGVYSMANPQTAGITSGRSKKPIKVTIDFDDDDFYQSFRPPSRPTASLPATTNKARPAPQLADLDSDIGLRDNSHSPDRPHQQRRLTKRSRDLVGKCTVDMDVEALQPGVTFSPKSFIREGHLHALINTLTPDYAPLRPNPTYLCGIKLSPLEGLDVSLQNLDRLFDGLLGLTSEIPSEGYEENLKDWDSLSRSACQHITWLYLRSPGGGRDRLSVFIKNKVLSIVASLKSKEIPTSSLNITILSLCWFCLEASIRCGHRLFEDSVPQDLNPAHASVRLLLLYLIGYGFRKPYKTARKNQTLDETKMPSHSAQMWVCLLHLLPSCAIPRPSNIIQENPLWIELLLHFQHSPSTNSLETAERMWKAVFTLMVLSQFSVFGITVGNFRLSASWSFIAHAIKQVQLAQNSSSLQHLRRDILEKRDAYISVVISRCYRLLDYWKWKMDQSFGALNQLVDIFRARNFVNLHGEAAEYPDFMLNGNWNALSQPSETDSAFTSILKLLKRAIDSDCLMKTDVRKMVALIIPVSKFRTQKEKLPGVDDLSPICNRFAALTFTIVIDPEHAIRTVYQVRKSIDFSAADSTTQILTIRGIKLLTSLLIKRDVDLREIAKWLTEVIEAVASGFTALKSPLTTVPPDKRSAHENNIRNHSLLILSLFATGRTIMETFASKARYPEPAFLLAFQPFLETNYAKVIEEVNCNLCEMRRFFESFLSARAIYLPVKTPTLPIARQDDPESQDYGSFDFDFEDPTTLIQLGCQENSFASIKEAEDGPLHPVIFQFFWVAKRKIHRFCQAAIYPIIDQDALRTLDSWIHGLVGCMHILIQHRKLEGWIFCFQEMTPIFQRIRLDWVKVRVRMALYSEIIRYDPAFFEPNRRELMEVFFESLAIHDITTEPRFWRYIVAGEIDNNPVFKDAAEPLRGLDTKDDNAELPNIREARLSLIKVLFKNIETGLEDMLEANAQISTSIDLCLKFFSMIRSVSQDLSETPEIRASYTAWCKDVLALLENYPRLKNHQRLKTILDLLS